MNYGGGKTWDQQSTPEMKLQAAKAFSQPPPAIVQQVKDLTYFRQRLKELSQKLEHDARTYRETVKEFKESGIWQPVHKTWAQACRAELHISPQRAHKLLAELTELYALENQPPLDQVAAIEDKYLSQVEHNRDHPAEKPQVQAATPEQMKPEPPRDDSGAVIPQTLLPLRERRQEVTALEHHASKLAAHWEKLQEGHDLLFAHAKASGSIQHFRQAARDMQTTLRECLTDVVCPQCNGANGTKLCGYCCGSGWISKVRWDREWVSSHDHYRLAIVESRAAK